MAILGHEGYIRLRREAPDPLVFTPDSLSLAANSLVSETQEFWTGDEVYLRSPFGLPISADGAPDGNGMYAGGKWALGPNRVHVADDSDQFWLQAGETAPGPPDGDPVAGDGAYFYTGGIGVKSGRYFIYIDQLNRISFYNTRQEAFFGSKDTRIQLFRINFGFLVLAATGSEDYDNAFAECVDRLGTYDPANIVDSSTLNSICDFAPTYEQPIASATEYQDADIQPRNRIGTQFPWEFICQLQKWELQTSGAAIDTTAVGQKFGENVKSIITGGGTIDFLVDRIYDADDNRDPTALMQLLLLTEKGSIADAYFSLITNRETNQCENRPPGDLYKNRLPGDLYYECRVLITNVALDVRPENFVPGTATFVTTSTIALRQGPN